MVTFSMTLTDPWPGFQGHGSFEVKYLKNTMLLKNTNRKPYTIFWMVPLSIPLSDLWPRFQGHDIFEVEYRKDKVTIAQEETIPNII